MMKLHNELESSLSELQRHLEVVLEDFDSEGNCLTIGYYDPTQNREFESIIADSLEFKRLMRCQTPEELLSFLSQRTIA